MRTRRAVGRTLLTVAIGGVVVGAAPALAGGAVMVGAAPALAGGPTSPAPVLRAAAVLLAPAAGTHGHLTPQIDVGLIASDGTSAAIAIGRVHNLQSQFQLMVSTTVGHSANGIGFDVPGVRAGDRIAVRLAVSSATPTRNGGNVTAVRVTDLRTSAVLYHSGASSLLSGGPRLPIGSVAKSHSNVVVVNGTWAEAWRKTTVNLDNAPFGDRQAYSWGVTQKAGHFVVTDRAHPTAKTGVPLSVATLQPRTGDRIVLTASTPSRGTHTNVAVVDTRTGRGVVTSG
jgi:hypothetical protein